MTEKQPAALETKNEQSESKPNTAKRYKTEKAELRRRIVSIVLLLVFVPAVIAVGMLEFNDRYYYITASLIIICSFIPFLMIFEKRRPRARELVVIAVMTALGVAGRAAFYMLPQFKPIAATVIITGVSLGCEAGFITGALTAFVSNMFFGQGPWTPWQMFALGLWDSSSGWSSARYQKQKLSVHYCAFTVHYQPFSSTAASWIRHMSLWRVRNRRWRHCLQHMLQGCRSTLFLPVQRWFFFWC